MYRKDYRLNAPGRAVAPLGETQATPTLAVTSDLDDQQIVDVCIGLPVSGGYMGRVLERTRTTLREALRRAGAIADRLARQDGAAIVDPSQLPSAIHAREDEGSFSVWLDYDLSVTLGKRPRVLRGMRLLMVALRKSTGEAIWSPPPPPPPAPPSSASADDDSIP